MSLDQVDDLLQASPAHPLPARHDHEQDVSLSMLSTGLSRIQDQVKFADAKGGFLATLGILLAGFVVEPASHLGGSTGVAVWVVHISPPGVHVRVTVKPEDVFRERFCARFSCDGPGQLPKAAVIAYIATVTNDGAK